MNYEQYKKALEIFDKYSVPNPFIITETETMNTLDNELLSAAQTIAPTNQVVEAVSDAIATASNPSVSNILADMELAVTLIKEFKAAIVNFHPSVLSFIKKAL